MNFKIDKDKLEITEPRIINSGSIAYYSVDCEFDDSWNGLTKKAVLIKKGDSQGTQIAVIGNQIYIDKSCYGDYYIGFVGYMLNNDNQKTLQISTELKGFYIQKGAGEIQVVETEVPPISEWEIYITQLVNISDIANTKIQEISNLEQSIEDAERDRSRAEQGREDEEQKRISAETTRAENETSRNSAEESRASAEQTRRTNESNRIVNENGRIEAENNRKNAETSRNSTETQRQSNETARQTAENAREDYITALRQSIENGDFDGATFIPHLDENGNLSWSNNKELDNPPTINIMGPQGPQGETGPKPVAGTDYYTQKEKENFAAQVIAESKTEIDNFTSDKKDEITDLATDKLKELSAVNTLKIISEEVIDL